MENAANTIEEEPEDKTESEQLESVSENRKEIEDEEKKDVAKVGPATTSSVAVEDEDVELRRKKEKAVQQQQQGGKGLFALGKETFGKIRRSMSFASGSSLWPKSQPKTIETQGSPKPSKSPEPTKSPNLSRSPDKQKGPHLSHS